MDIGCLDGCTGAQWLESADSRRSPGSIETASSGSSSTCRRSIGSSGFVHSLPSHTLIQSLVHSLARNRIHSRPGSSLRLRSLGRHCLSAGTLLVHSLRLVHLGCARLINGSGLLHSLLIVARIRVQVDFTESESSGWQWVTAVRPTINRSTSPTISPTRK